MTKAKAKVQLIPGVDVRDPLRVKLEAWPIEKSLIMSGKPKASGIVLHKSADGKAADGVWECTPGSFQWNYTWDETFYMLKGRARIAPEGGKAVEFQQGEIVHFPKGLRTTWEVQETIRKVFFLRSDQDLGL